MKSEIQKLNKLETQADAIVYFLQRLDIEMVNDILDDNRTYQNFKKNVFIQKLTTAIDEFIINGDTFLHCYKGFCNSEACNYKCTGFSFIGDNSKNYLDLIIDVNNGIVQDIYECAIFESYDIGLEKRTRIYIDKSR